MAKSFISKRTLQGQSAMKDAAEYFLQRTRQAEKKCGRYSAEALEAVVLSASIYCASEDYEKTAPSLAGYVAVEKGLEPPNPMWMFWARGLLVETYFNLGRISEAMRISKEGKSMARAVDPSAADPLLEALLEQGTVLKAKGDLKSRQRGFVVGLVALCRSISHGFQRTPFGSAFLERLRLFFNSYGIHEDAWEWTVKHAHLTRYDFAGLLSILLHHTGLTTKPSSVIEKRGSAHNATQP